MSKMMITIVIALWKVIRLKLHERRCRKYLGWLKNFKFSNRLKRYKAVEVCVIATLKKRALSHELTYSDITLYSMASPPC